MKLMKNKFLLFGFLFLVFSFIFYFVQTTGVSAKQLADVGNPGNDGYTKVVEIENVEIPLSDKLILKDGTPVKEVFNSTDDMVNLIVKVVFVGAGTVLFVMIIMAGFSMIGGDSKDKDKAKTTMTSAAIGFIVMFAAYWIMQIIQLLTGVNMGF